MIQTGVAAGQWRRPRRGVTISSGIWAPVFVVDKQAGSHAFLALDTSDCIGDCTRMKALRREASWRAAVRARGVRGCSVKISMATKSSSARNREFGAIAPRQRAVAA